MLNNGAKCRGLNVSLSFAVGALMLLAIMACGGSDDPPAASPTAPSGLFSTLPTTEPPIEGDQPPTVELNTPEPTFTPQPTFTPNPTYTPVPSPTPDPTATPVPTPTSVPTATPNPTATPVPTATPEPTSTPTPTTSTAPDSTTTPLPRGGGALLNAIKDRNVASVRTLIAGGFAVNVSDEDGNPFLYIAIKRGDDAFFTSDIQASKDIVEILINAGADVNVRNATDGNPAVYSAFAWRSDVVQILVDAGADVNARIAGGETLLEAAVRLAGDAFFTSDIERYQRIVQILVDAGAIQ